MLDKYIKWLNEISTKFNNREKITNFFKTYKWKIVIFIFLFQAIQIMYTFYNRGHCINCNMLTKEKVVEMGGDVKKLKELTDTFIYVPYTDIKTYLGDIILPILFQWAIMFFVFSVLYIITKISWALVKGLRKNLTRNLQIKQEEILKQQRKK